MVWKVQFVIFLGNLIVLVAHICSCHSSLLLPIHLASIIVMSFFSAPMLAVQNFVILYPSSSAEYLEICELSASRRFTDMRERVSYSLFVIVISSRQSLLSVPGLNSDCLWRLGYISIAFYQFGSQYLARSVFWRSYVRAWYVGLDSIVVWVWRSGSIPLFSRALLCIWSILLYCLS